MRPGDLLFGCDVAPARAGLQPLGRDADINFVDLAIAARWRKANQVLAVQLVGDLAERFREVIAGTNLDVPAAGLLGDARETWIG